MATTTATPATELAFRFSPKISEPLKDENNYPEWSIEMARLFRITKLAGYVTGPHAAKPTEPDKYDEWQDKTDIALMLMIEYCEKVPASYIRACEDAGTAWTILKSRYEGRTRTHLSALLLSITNLRFDGRKTSITEHIAAFEAKWLTLAQSVSTATAGTDSLAAGIKDFVNTDGWKATLLLSTLPHIQSTLPHIQTYQNVVDSIVSKDDAPSV